MSENLTNKMVWETPNLQILNTKQITKSGLVILPIEILTVQGPS